MRAGKRNPREASPDEDYEKSGKRSRVFREVPPMRDVPSSRDSPRRGHLPDREEEEEGGSGKTENRWSSFPINDLPRGVLGDVFSFAAPEGKGSLRIVLRSVCKLWNDVASRRAYERRRFSSPYERGTFSSAGAETDIGIQKVSDHVALDALQTSRFVDSVALLFDAAEFGYEALCELAQEWRGARKFSAPCVKRALFIAAKAGRENVCALFKEWTGEGPDKTLPLVYAVEMCRGAAVSGNAALCAEGRAWCSHPLAERLAKVAVNAGAMGGHEHICDMGCRWSPRGRLFVQQLMGSAEGGREVLFRRAYRMAMTYEYDWRVGIVVAAANGHEGLCLAALEIGGMPEAEWAEVVLTGAAVGGAGALCELALIKGARDLHRARALNEHYEDEGVRLVLARWGSKLES